jgi:hypothetical protein
MKYKWIQGERPEAITTSSVNTNRKNTQEVLHSGKPPSVANLATHVPANRSDTRAGDRKPSAPGCADSAPYLNFLSYSGYHHYEIFLFTRKIVDCSIGTMF